MQALHHHTKIAYLKAQTASFRSRKRECKGTHEEIKESSSSTSVHSIPRTGTITRRRTKTLRVKKKNILVTQTSN